MTDATLSPLLDRTDGYRPYDLDAFITRFQLQTGSGLQLKAGNKRVQIIRTVSVSAV